MVTFIENLNSTREIYRQANSKRKKNKTFITQKKEGNKAAITTKPETTLPTYAQNSYSIKESPPLSTDA